MNLVELGDLRVSPEIKRLMDAGFDAAPYLFEHRRGSPGDLMNADQIFEHITDICRGLTVYSVHDTEYGALHIVTRPAPPRSTLLALGAEICP